MVQQVFAAYLNVIHCCLWVLHSRLSNLLLCLVVESKHLLHVLPVQALSDPIAVALCPFAHVHANEHDLQDCLCCFGDRVPNKDRNKIDDKFSMINTGWWWPLYFSQAMIVYKYTWLLNNRPSVLDTDIGHHGTEDFASWVSRCSPDNSSLAYSTATYEYNRDEMRYMSADHSLIH